MLLYPWTITYVCVCGLCGFDVALSVDDRSEQKLAAPKHCKRRPMSSPASLNLTTKYRIIHEYDKCNCILLITYNITILLLLMSKASCKIRVVF